MNNRRICALCTLFAAALLIVPGTASAEANKDVKDVYQRFADYLAQHDKFSVDMTLEYTASVGDESEWSVTTYHLAFVRPNTVSIKVDNPRIKIEYYLENGTITQYLPAVNQYVTKPANMAANELVARTGIGPIADAMVVFMQLVMPEPFKTPLEYALNSEYKGEVEIDNKMYDKVNLDFDAVSWDAWIAKGDQPLLFRVVPKLPVVENFFMEKSEKHVDIDVVMDFKNWNFDTDAVNQALVFAAKDSAEQIDSFTPPAPDDPEKGLVAKAAPQFELAALDGSAFKLADKIGREIIVLDFWATWCGPCRKAMPIVKKVTDEFANKDVRLYAVNLEEDPDTIRGFLDNAGLDVHVLMDSSGKVKNQYLANAIPETVIIGKDGVVQAVHVGVAPDLEDTLRSQLTTLTDGGSLISKE